MKPGDVVLAILPQVGGQPPKLRPALYLASLPGPYQSILLCGISTQLHAMQAGWDELIQPGDADFRASGLRYASIIRLSFLQAVTASDVAGILGDIAPARLHRLRQRLSDHLRP